jgi:F-type H+-transporting ATPase subunit delta
MSEYRAAHRYALALIGLAEGRKEVEEVGKDLRHLDRLISGSRDFRLFLQSPVVNARKKRQILDGLLRGRIGEPILLFLFFLASRRREGLLPEIIVDFFRLLDERTGIVDATASVAVPLSPPQEQRLVARLEQATGKKVRIRYVVDRSLKAGFMVRIDDTVWDASVRHELDHLRRTFAAGPS